MRAHPDNLDLSKLEYSPSLSMLGDLHVGSGLRAPAEATLRGGPTSAIRPALSALFREDSDGDSSPERQGMASLGLGGSGGGGGDSGGGRIGLGGGAARGSLGASAADAASIASVPLGPPSAISLRHSASLSSSSSASSSPPPLTPRSPASQGTIEEAKAGAAAGGRGGSRGGGRGEGGRGRGRGDRGGAGSGGGRSSINGGSSSSNWQSQPLLSALERGETDQDRGHGKGAQAV